jgi:hypothetical protein
LTGNGQNVTDTQLIGTQLITLDIDCEDFANLLCLTTQDYKHRPFIEIQQSLASICEIMPDSLKVMKPTFDIMFLALKGQESPVQASKPVDLQKLDSRSAMSSLQALRLKTLQALTLLNSALKCLTSGGSNNI